MVRTRVCEISMCGVGGKRWMECPACEKGDGCGLERIVCVKARVRKKDCRIASFREVDGGKISDVYGGVERLWGGERVDMGCKWV